MLDRVFVVRNLMFDWGVVFCSVNSFINSILLNSLILELSRDNPDVFDYLLNLWKYFFLKNLEFYILTSYIILFLMLYKFSEKIILQIYGHLYTGVFPIFCDVLTNVDYLFTDCRHIFFIFLSKCLSLCHDNYIKWMKK